MESHKTDLTAILDPCRSLIREVGAFIKNASIHLSEISVKDKNHNNLVTKIDKESEQRLVEGLKKILPNSGFITEEKTVAQQKRDYVWIIDPLDGTTNFIHGIPFYSISVALSFNDKIILGLVYDIHHENLYHAILGSGAFKNDIAIGTSATKELANALIATGFPYDSFDLLEDYLQLLSALMKSTRGVRRLGSAALDLCYLAEGLFDVFFEYNLEIWDVAAGALIVTEAGGRVSDFRAEEHFLNRKELVSTNAHLFEKFFPLLKSHIKVEN